MKRLLLAAASLLLFAVSAHAQGAIIARDGWEAFPMVAYQGGDSTQAKKLAPMMLVLDDTSLSLHECNYDYCKERKDKAPFRKEAKFSIPLTSITGLNGSSRVRGADTAGKVFLGGLASDRAEDFISIVYETASSAEAPVFKTEKAIAGAIDAKLRYRLKRIGVELREK